MKQKNKKKRVKEKKGTKINKKLKVEVKSNISVVLNIYRKNYPPIKTEMAAIKVSAGSVVCLRFDWTAGFMHIVGNIGFS